MRRRLPEVDAEMPERLRRFVLEEWAELPATPPAWYLRRWATASQRSLVEDWGLFRHVRAAAAFRTALAEWNREQGGA